MDPRSKIRRVGPQDSEAQEKWNDEWCRLLESALDDVEDSADLERERLRRAPQMYKPLGRLVGCTIVPQQLRGKQGGNADDSAELSDSTIVSVSSGSSSSQGISQVKRATEEGRARGVGQNHDLQLRMASKETSRFDFPNHMPLFELTTSSVSHNGETTLSMTLQTVEEQVKHEAVASARREVLAEAQKHMGLEAEEQTATEAWVNAKREAEEQAQNRASTGMLG